MFLVEARERVELGWVGEGVVQEGGDVLGAGGVEGWGLGGCSVVGGGAWVVGRGRGGGGGRGLFGAGEGAPERHGEI